jgi:phage terminase small subunit
MAARRTPNNVHKLKGTFRADRHSQGPADYQPPAEGYPRPPEYLIGLALAVWGEVEQVMGKCNLYTQADAAKLARYCCIEAEFRTAPVEFPAAKLSQLRLMERDLYLDPEARAKVGGASASKSANPFEGL